MLGRTGKQLIDRASTPSKAEPFGPLATERRRSETPIGADLDNDVLQSLMKCTLSEGGVQTAKQKEDNTEQSNGSRLLRRPNASYARRLTIEAPDRTIGNFLTCQSSKPQVSPAAHPAQALQTPGLVLSVWGRKTSEVDAFEPHFTQKHIHFDGELRILTHHVGMVCHRGDKPTPNQDDFFLLSRSEYLLVGVLDGHGPDGHDVAHFGQERLPTYLVERLRKGVQWSQAVPSAFEHLCKEMRDVLGDKAHDSGTTVSVVRIGSSKGVHGSLRIDSAHVGDSTIVHGVREGKSWVVKSLTRDHKPDREDESKRIVEMGGRIEPSVNGDSARLVTPDCSIAMSRSLGDFACREYGLSNEPEIADELMVDDTHEHLIMICSDGVWDMVPPVQAVNFVGKFKPEEAQLAVERLVARAKLRWQEANSHVDDITAILVWLNFGASAP